MKKINLNLPVMGILNNPQTEWNQMRKSARGNIRTAFRDLNVDWKKYNTKDYLFTHDSIVCSVETEENGYNIKKPCEELVNANGNAWKNEVLLHCFRTFIGGDNFCFPGGTRVLMSDGTYKNIEDVKIGDKVINAKGEIDTVVNTFCHSYTGKTITLKNPNILSKELTCTGNHPFYVYQDRGTSTVSGKPIKLQRKKERPIYEDVGLAPGERSGDLKESRWGHPKYLNASDLNDERNLLIYPVSDCVVENSEINENRAFLIGWFLAEGSYVNTDKGITFSLSKDEKDIAEKICKLLEIEFPEKCLSGIVNVKDKQAFIVNAKDKHAKFTVYKNPKFNEDSYIVINYYSSSANAFFRKWCNEYSWAKCLPEEAMYLPLELQKTMLLQYIEGDGCYTLKSRGASVSSKSQKLIQQMRFIAIRLGVFPVYREIGVLSRYSESVLKDGYPVFIDPNTGKLSRPGYMLTFNCDDWSKLSGGDKPKHSSFSTKFENNFVFRFTKEEEDVEELIVYNFETEKDHSYIAEGVAVHNCEHIQIPALSKGKILDAIIRPVVHHSKYGDANIYVVDILVATDRRHQELVSRIESGKLNTLSMGAVCEVCQCSICGKLIKDDDKNCEHLENYLGSHYKCEDGKKRIVAELCGALDENGNYIENSCNFIEASWVEHPAFEGAVVNAFIETEEEKIAREKSQKELEDLFNGSLFERLRVADTDSKIALKILKDYNKAEKYLEIARKIAKDNM